MKNELVSIIIPTFKRTNTLERAIDSAIAQTYNNIEIIIVDDNADYPNIREQNRNLLKKYKNSKIFFVENKKNLGGGLSRNEGIKYSNGKFVAFLDDDDEYFPKKIEEQMKLYKKLNNDKIAMIYCYAEMVKIDGTSYISDRLINGNNIYEHVSNCIAATSWWFCPKDKLLSVGCFEDISSRQDASLLLKLLLKEYEFYCAPKVLLKYYCHNSNSGISKTDYKSIEAEKQYREIFLNNCNSLTIKQRKKVLNIYSFRIAHLYILLKNRRFAFRELIKMLNYKLFSIKNIRIIFGIIFNNLYRYISHIRNSKKN